MLKQILAALAVLATLFAGCASAGDEGPNRSEAGSGNPNPSGASLLEFTIAINPNGEVDRSGRGIYAILINAQGTPIEVTDLDTFTDVIRFDGRNFDWYHRLAEVPNPGFTFAQVGPLSGQAQVLPDGKSIQIIIDTADSTSFINQFVPAQVFTAHVVTTDTEGGGLLGRLIDTQGQGPNIDSNSLQTVTVTRGLGATNPLPQSYPFDPLNDVKVQTDLGDDFPYANFDIVRFEVTAR
ncbi:MAG: hypothetical protein WC314_00030 [Vulcanimicrobiota bacterium]